MYQSDIDDSVVLIFGKKIEVLWLIFLSFITNLDLFRSIQDPAWLSLLESIPSNTKHDGA
jgi:hypothetical protein